jgi:4-amino-4-deoxy-L-arabinose transferase-like glycosyltransferase
MFSVHGGHYVSFFPIVLPVLVTPLYVIPYLFLIFFHIPVDVLNPSFEMICLIMDKIAASFVAALSAIFLYMSLKNLFSKKIALLCTLIYAFATSTWAISSQSLWQHGAVELFSVILLYLVVMNEKQENRNNFLLMGLLSGLLFFCRPVDSILLLPVIYYVFVHNTKEKLYYFCALILASLPFAAYNFYFFNNLFGGYISNVSLFSLNFNAIISFFGLIISPNRGLFIFSPVCFLAIFGISGIKKIKTKKMQYFLILMAISVLCQIIVYSFFKIWWAGWCYGPRFLTGMIPFFMIFLALYFDTFSKTTWTEKGIRKYFIILVIIILICWSVFVQIVGAFYYPKNSWDANPDIDQNTQRLWDWNDSQILYSFWAGPYPTNGISVFLNKSPTDNFLKIQRHGYGL